MFFNVNVFVFLGGGALCCVLCVIVWESGGKAKEKKGCCLAADLPPPPPPFQSTQINNAGVMAVSNLERTKEGFERHIGVNHLGTRFILPASVCV